MSWKSNILLISCFIYLAHGGIESLSNNSPERESKEVILFDRIASAIFGKEDGLAIGRDKNYLAKKKFPSKTSMKQESTTFEGISNSNEQQFRNNKKKSFQMDRWQTAKPTSMAQLKDLQVQCEIEMMRVRVIFDRPFRGLIFSKGYYSDRKCIHTPSGLGQTVVTFDISLRSCGMVSSFNNDNHSPQGQYIENTIIIQYDPQLQEVWDQARKLRCTWYDFYEKSVTFQPYRVNTLDPVTANFLGDNLRCWMQIQVGKGPHASEVSGIVKIGQTMTMVLGIKDDENKFDMMIRNCVAHDGLRSPITLVNERGCIVRSKIMSNFKKIKNFDVTANVLAFAYFQAFKFPDSMNVHFQCVVQVCRDYCPDPICSDKTVSDAYESNRGSLLSHRNSNSVINPRSIIEPSNLPGAINNKSTRSLESYRSVDDSKKNCQRN
ncbi:cuticlin-1 isoform X2 [Lepeophtheirus salmonis]|uniref:cuticlin-1 isoform X2 n=1 Tax=Lepeophtheirus salmonis TaxID=72036 RepID=UPI001AE36771|nr:uncharacterized protein LOC121127338 isoform X2 [Lepeophtheirus salmonis]